MARVTREGEMTLLRAFEIDADGAAGVDERALAAGGSRRHPSRRAGRPRAIQNFDELWAPFPLGVGPSGAYCASLDLKRRQALRPKLGR
jgi:hypothetical protein